LNTRQLINHPRCLIHHRLSKALLAGKEFSRVVLYDIQPPSEELLPGEQYVQGATQDQQCFQDCLTKHSPVSVVFHVAAYGMSGAASLDKKKTWEVNVVVSSATAGSSSRLVADTTAVATPSPVISEGCLHVGVQYCSMMAADKLPYAA
jgi:UDP-glucose 4-epimerase